MLWVVLVAVIAVISLSVVVVVVIVAFGSSFAAAANGGGEIGVKGLDGLRVTCWPPIPVRSSRAFFWGDSLPFTGFGFLRIGGRGVRVFVFVFEIGSEFDLAFEFLVVLSDLFSSVGGVGGSWTLTLEIVGSLDI